MNNNYLNNSNFGGTPLYSNGVISPNQTTAPTINNEYIPNSYNSLFLILSCICMSIGIVVPGISNTVILMLLGVYNTYLSAISVVNMNVLFPMMFGAGIGCIIFMKIIQKLLNKYYSQTISGIIGFSLGSILIIYPGYSFNLESIISIIIIALGFAIGKHII